MLNVPTHGARQNRFFDVAPFLDEILELIAVRDAHDVLFDNWPFVQFLRHVMAGRTDKFYAALEGVMIGPGSAEGGQKGMMDVDDSLPVSLHERWRENLHVARQHHEADVVFT